MKSEISEKLANELLERLQKLDEFASKKAKENNPGRYDCDSNWMFAACELSSIIQHIRYHLNYDVELPKVEVK